MSVPMRPDDPAYWMLFDGHETTPTTHRPGCYICEDPEFAQMGLPLCSPCPYCMARADGLVTGHVAADDEDCDDCGKSLRAWYEDASSEAIAAFRAAIGKD